VKLTRRVAFSSGHRYWLDGLSEEENRSLFGRWASRFNHGHNYVLEATYEGRVSPEDGMVINIKELDALIRDRVVSVCDQRSLNDEVPELSGIVPTTENLALFAHGRLSATPPSVRLSRVRLYETPTLYADVRSGDNEAVTLTRVYEFSASHRLHCPELPPETNRELFGKCNNPAGHGHNYVVEVSVEGAPDAKTGMVADIEAIDRAVLHEVVDRYDHKHLNEDIEEFRGVNPTTEVLTRTIWRRLSGKLPAKLSRVVVRETARNIFEYAGEDE
jgi:6-pyruvoyltetrahydropterin/6-carboxytetrahydropterin synthase